MENFRSFRKNRNISKKSLEDSEKIEEKPFESDVINLNEDDDDDDFQETPKFNKIKDNSQNKGDDCESFDASEEERMTLGIIEKNISLERKRSRIKELNDKDCFNGFITYDKRKRKLEKIFSGTVEDLNDFLAHCQVKKISFENISPYIIKSNNTCFDPLEWMKSKNIYRRTLNLEDLIIYINNKKDENQNNIIQKVSLKNKKDIKEEKLINFIPNFKDARLHNNYVELKKIILSKGLSKEQKNWINDFIGEIGKIDIKDIKIEKDKQGKEQKLDIVFDLDNTIIFSFLSSEDNIFIQSKKDIFPKKEVRMISFNFNDIVIYTILILRKGFKEFIQYVEPLCTFHISTLGCENYGNEVKNILNEYTGIDFIRYKGRVYSNESTKTLDDLYLSKERTIIFDDNVNVWKNKNNEYVINTKFFYDEECAMINLEENLSENSNKSERDIFKKTYKFFYNHMNPKNWKKQEIKECTDVPFYQFKQIKDFNYNRCYTAEYLTSEKYQFIYMKNVIKEIYYLKFVYGIEIPLAIKLIRIGTLANMKFNLNYLYYFEKIILTDMINSCGGIIYNGKNRDKNEKVYLIVSKRNGLKYKKEGILKEINENNFYVLLNEKFILDSYYFMTNLIGNINDEEYIYKI